MVCKFSVVCILGVVIVSFFVLNKYFFFIWNLENSGIYVYRLICGSCLFGIYFMFIKYYLEV